jgi:hypothetical protein
MAGFPVCIFTLYLICKPLTRLDKTLVNVVYIAANPTEASPATLTTLDKPHWG